MDENYFGERIGHPRREWKPEFKKGRYPPLDEPACSVSFSIRYVRGGNLEYVPEINPQVEHSIQIRFLLPATTGELDEQNGHLKTRRFKARRIPIKAPTAQSGINREIPVKKNTLAIFELGKTTPMNTDRNNSGPRAQILIHSLKDGMITIYYRTMSARARTTNHIRL